MECFHDIYFVPFKKQCLDPLKPMEGLTHRIKYEFLCSILKTTNCATIFIVYTAVSKVF
jgi:hypothetical protein